MNQATGLSEFLRTDDPPVRDADDPNRCCGTCRYWSRWLPSTGDCLYYALLRRQAIIDGRPAVPPKAARTSSDLEVCDGWEAREGRGLSQ